MLTTNTHIEMILVGWSIKVLDNTVFFINHVVLLYCVEASLTDPPQFRVVTFWYI